MHLAKRDLFASVLVGLAGLVYILWLAGSPLPQMGGTRATGVLVLVLGFLASATAVVPSFDRLLHGSKVYLAVTSAIGLVAAIAGVLMVIDRSRVALAVVMVAMVVLWAIATLHHSQGTRAPTRR